MTASYAFVLVPVLLVALNLLGFLGIKKDRKPSVMETGEKVLDAGEALEVIGTSEVIAKYMGQDVYDWIKLSDGLTYSYQGPLPVNPHGEFDLSNVKMDDFIITPGLVYRL